MLIGIPGAYAEVTHGTARLPKMATALADATPTDNVVFPELLHQVKQAMLCSVSAERLQQTRYAVVTGRLFSGHQQGPDEEFSVAETPLGNIMRLIPGFLVRAERALVPIGLSYPSASSQTGTKTTLRSRLSNISGCMRRP